MAIPAQATPVAAQSTEPAAGSQLAPAGAFPAAPMGFFTDTTICIGCKACEVACKEWNGVPDSGLDLLGMSYDNTGALTAKDARGQSMSVVIDRGLAGQLQPGQVVRKAYARPPAVGCASVLTRATSPSGGGFLKTGSAS